MKRAIPMLLLVLGGAGAFVGWRSGETGRRYARIHELLRSCQDKAPHAWTEDDREALWDQITWFHRGDTTDFALRIVASVASGDAEERRLALLLAAHIAQYEILNQSTLVSLEAWKLPLPDPRKHRLDGFPFRWAVQREPEAFAAMAEDPGDDVRRALVYLAEAGDGPALRDAFIRIAAEGPSWDLRYFAIMSLGELDEDATSARALSTLASEADIGTRFYAAAGLARRADPAGSRLFVEFLTDLQNDLGLVERGLGIEVLLSRYPSLAELGDDPWRDDALRGWATWLEFREHEGFRSDVQEARDGEWIETYGSSR